MLPWFTYNYVTLGRFTLSPAGGIGRGLWEGSWQATWSGRLQNELTHLADDIDDRAELDRRVESVAAREHLPAGRCSTTSISGRTSGASGPSRSTRTNERMPRVKADQEYLRVALENIRARLAGASRQAAGARRVHPVGRRNSVPLQRDQPAAADAHSRLLGGAGAAVLAALVGLVVLARSGRVGRSVPARRAARSTSPPCTSRC